MIRMPALFAVTILLAVGPLAAGAHEPAQGAASASTIDAAAQPAAQTVDAFHAALKRADTAAALALLADDALIFEEGGAERSKAEYAASHLAADAAFSTAVQSVQSRRSGRASGRLVWIATESRTTGRYRNRDINSVGTETMVLRRDGANWRIVHIHWSSRTIPS